MGGRSKVLIGKRGESKTGKSIHTKELGGEYRTEKKNEIKIRITFA